MSEFLSNILNQKRKEVALLKERYSREFFLQTGSYFQKKSLAKALVKPRSIIAEIKRSSPANGDLAIIPDPVQLAICYEKAGSSAISVLTDQAYFKGSIQDLTMVSLGLRHSACPILRKEFIIDLFQIMEAAHHGADAVLLIVAVLQYDTQLFIDEAAKHGLEVLLEVHTDEELSLALDTSANMIGINNRNLKTLEVDVNTSMNLIHRIPKSITTISESGIPDVKTADRLFEAGFNALLVGEALVKSNDPVMLIKSMREGAYEYHQN